LSTKLEMFLRAPPFFISESLKALLYIESNKTVSLNGWVRKQFLKN